MPQLPRGTVTFLFTDIEGSTLLWEENASGMRRAVERHFAVLDQAVGEHGGASFKRVGDALQAAFWRAPDGIAAAVEAQRRLAEEDWSGFGPKVGAGLSVRMALHSGDAAPDEEGDYLAACLNRLARLLGTAHGGQILITDLTRRLAQDVDGGELELTDLGLHQLRDLGEPERIHQLIAPGLRRDFPPLRVAARRPPIPAPSGAMVNRQAELEQAMSVLADPRARLLTVTGPGGVGKTRLAQELIHQLATPESLAAGRLDDGSEVAYAALDALIDAARVPSAVASALGIKEPPTSSLEAAVAQAIGSRRQLLILDNVEQVMDCAPWVAGLLDACPNLRVLATSREPLGLSGERELPVAPLDVWGDSHRQTDRAVPVVPSHAAVLFIERARLIRPDFAYGDHSEDIERICAALDGLPLAVELAAARVRAMSPAAIAAELLERSGSLDLLTGGTREGPARHRTLRATIDWSFGLLSEREASLFSMLGAFGRSFSADAVAGVADRMGTALDRLAVMDALESLAQKSLIRPDQGDSYVPRFTVLAPLLEYARERLDAAGQAVAARDAHLAAFVERAAAARRDYQGTAQADAIDQVHFDLDNYRRALDWAHQSGAAIPALTLASALARLFLLLGLPSEGRGYLAASLAAAGDDADPALLGEAYNGAGFLAWAVGDRVAAGRWLDRSLVVRRLAGEPEPIARTLNNLGILALEGGKIDEAAQRYREALDLLTGDGHDLVRSGLLLSLGTLEGERLHVEDATDLLEECLRLKERLGDGEGAAAALTNLAVLAVRRGRPEEALALADRALTTQRAIGDRSGIASSLGVCADAHRVLGSLREARRDAGESLSIRLEIGDLHGQARSLWEMAALGASEAPGRGAAWMGASAAALSRAGIELSPADLATVAAVEGTLDAQLGSAERRRLEEEGGRLALDDAAREALAWSKEVRQGQTE